MDLESKAEHIRDMRGSHAPDEQRKILQDILDGVPTSSGPSLANQADYVRIFSTPSFFRGFPSRWQPATALELGLHDPASGLAMDPWTINE